MVRLKGNFNATPRICAKDFNSSMVRLKVRKPANLVVYGDRFQFLYGAIKSIYAFMYFVAVIKFQFLYGAIKRRGYR